VQPTGREKRSQKTTAKIAHNGDKTRNTSMPVAFAPCWEEINSGGPKMAGSNAATALTERPKIYHRVPFLILASRILRERICCWRKISISLIDQLSGLECVMRWILLCLGSIATGVLTIVLSLALLLVSLSVYGTYVLGVASNETIGWDPVSTVAVRCERDGAWP
jgi:hypothetical protein